MNIKLTRDARLIAGLCKPVQELHRKLYPKYFKPFVSETVRSWFQNVIDSDEDSFFFVIEEERETVGYAWIQKATHQKNPFRNGFTSIEVNQISIIPGKQHKGYGTALMQHILQFAKDQGIDEVNLDYWTGNQKAADFYQKQGFEIYRNFVHKLL
jgi:Acetyltransferases